MAQRLDQEIKGLLRRLTEWRRQERTSRNQSMLAIGERAIREKLRAVSRQRRRAVTA